MTAKTKKTTELQRLLTRLAEARRELPKATSQRWFDLIANDIRRLERDIQLERRFARR